MSSARCIAAITGALGREATAAEMEKLVERLESRMAAKRRARGAKSDAQLYREAAAELSEEVTLATYYAKRSRLLNQRAYNAGIGRIQEFVQQGMKPHTALLSMAGGAHGVVDGARDSIDLRFKSLQLAWTVGILRDLRELGPEYPKLFRTKEMELPLAKEIWELSKRAAGEDATPGISGNDQARKIAEVVHKWMETSRAAENDAGSWRGATAGYIHTQGHNSQTVYRAGFEAWRKKIEPLLDEKTFDRDQGKLDHLETQKELAGWEWIGAQATLTKRLEELRKSVDPKMRRAAATLDAYPDKLAALETAARGLEAAFRDQPPSIDTIKRLSRGLADARRWITAAADTARKKAKNADIETLRLIDDADRAHDRMRAAEQKMLAAADQAEGLNGRMDDKGAFLKAAYDNIVTDTWRTAEGARADFDGNFPFVGPGNLAMKVSTHRVFQFKSPEAFLDYHREFGRGTLSENIVQDLRHSARNTALMQMLGTNPEAMWTKLRDYVADQWHGDRGRVQAALGRQLDWLYADVSGRTEQIAKGPNASTVAVYSQAVRTWESMAKLGGMLLSSLGDVFSHASEMRYQGHNFLSSYSGSLNATFEKFQGAERQHVADLIGVGAETWMGQVAGRFADNDAVPGKMAKSMQAFFRLTGVAFWTDSRKQAAALMTSRHLAMVAGEPWEKLRAADQRLMTLYGIEKNEWEVIRRAPTEEAHGKEFLSPYGVDRLDLESFMPLTNNSIDPVALQRTQNDLSLKLRMMLIDRADFAVPTPGARTRAWMHMGTQRGDALGEGLRFIMQFKAFPISLYERQFGRDLLSNGEGATRSGTMAMVETILGMTALGYAAMASKDVAKGYWPPRDPLDPRTMFAAAVQGGGLGILGDYLFGEFNRMGQSPGESALGPTLGTAVDIIKIWSQLRARSYDDKADPSGQMVQTIAGNIPYFNHFLLKPVTEGLILRSIKESLNPGAQRRAERRREKDYGQRPWY